ncbi:MAG TPA: NADH-quinone oxidoreductase subunit B family protein [Terracidiphilus sp.]|nr:NADH-quinone oxidoreductase subunit B family protein [Terracidiphilus sp.]
MIFDIVQRSLSSPKVLVSIEELIANSLGSRIPDVHAIALTVSIARRAVDSCGISALAIDEVDGRSILSLDYGKCTGCGHCVEVGEGAFFQAENVACGVSRLALVRRWDVEHGVEILCDEAALTSAAREIRSIVGGALNIRQVDGGSCNGCEAEIGALTNPYYDLERFGIHFVASPKHADMLLVTGPITRNMAEAVKRTYEATPSPKLVVAVGACGCSGGIFAESPEVAGSVDSVIPVDAFIPGCPPTPAMLLTGILRVLSHRQLRGRSL